MKIEMHNSFVIEETLVGLSSLGTCKNMLQNNRPLWDTQLLLCF